jgi:hypothetical protein
VPQLRAFDVARARKRLIVRKGKRSWWGVDPSTKRIAIAYVTPDGTRGSAIRSLPTLSGADRLEAIRIATIELCELLRTPAEPGVIVVEEPAGFGKRPNPELAYACGAVLCGLVPGAPHTHVDFVASSKWKADVCGYGGIAKPKPTEKRSYEVLQWAQGVGYDGSSWDESDAWAIAEYARGTYELDERG